MVATPIDFELLREKLEREETALYLAQWKYHLAEAKRIARELERRQIHLDDVMPHLNSRAGKPRGTSHPEGAKKADSTPRRPSSQCYRTEGPTVVIVRLLYETRAGMTRYEMQARNGIAIKARMLRKIINRIVNRGDAAWEEDNLVLTDQGIASWEASPLFLRSTRNNKSHAA